MKKLICILFIAIPIFIFGQQDIEFWFVAPDYDSAHDDSPIGFSITTSELGSKISISQPANAAFAEIIDTIPPNSTKYINVTPFKNLIENAPADQILNKGIKITSSTPIFVYYDESSYSNPELFSLKGANALGTEFYIPMQTFLRVSANYSNATCGFEIVATEDNTNVTIVPTKDLKGHPANVPFTITLNRGQTYSAQAIGKLGSDHPAGTHVTSNKPIAISIKDDSMTGFGTSLSQDAGGDQIVPITALGSEYVAVRGLLNDPFDKLFIMAIEDGTKVFANQTLVTTINKGVTYEYDMGNVGSAYITSNKPISVLQLSGFLWEAGLSILPAINCSGSSSVSVTRTKTDNFILMVVADSSSIGNFLFNGNPNIIKASDFALVPSTNGLWRYAKVSISTAVLPINNVARIDNNNGIFHLGVLQGESGQGTGFGYFSGFNQYKFKINTLSNMDSICVGDTIRLSVNSVPNSTFAWSGPNGFSDTTQTITIPIANTNQSGNYAISGNVKECAIHSDTTKITIRPTPDGSITSNSPLMEGETLEFIFNGNSDLFSWTGPNAFSSDLENPTKPNITKQDSGTYYLNIQSNYGCNRTLSTLVIINSELVFGNVITPNGDGINDVFKITNISSFENELSIFNRWGKRVYYCKNYKNDWGAKNVSEGTYYCVFKYGKDLENLYKGTITVIKPSK